LQLSQALRNVTLAEPCDLSWLRNEVINLAGLREPNRAAQS
jgi:hypothetical protein